MQIKQNTKNILFIVLIIVSMTFALRASNNMLFTMVPLFCKYELMFNTAQVGLLSAIFAFFPFLISAFVNAKLSSKKRKKLFIFSALLYFLSFLMFYLANQLSIWLIVSLAGVALGALMPNIITAAGLCEDRVKRERLIAIYTITLSASLVIGPLIESLLLRYFSIRESFLVFSLLPLIAFTFSFFIQFPKEENTSSKKVTVLKNDYFVISILNILIYNIPFAALITFGGIYAKEVLNTNYSHVNLYFSVFFASSFIGRLYLIIRPPQRIFRYMIISGILTTIGITILLFSNAVGLFVFSLFILGFPHGFTFVLSLISISRGFDIDVRNRANSYFFSIVNIIGGFTPILLGYFLHFVGISSIFYLLIPFVVFFLILLVLKIRYLKKYV